MAATRVLEACPLCDAGGVTYEFVAAGLTYSQCPACGLLFADPSAPAAAFIPNGGSAGTIEGVLRLASRYTGSPARNAVIVGELNDTVGGLPVVTPSQLANERGAYDLVILLGGVERAADPRDLLRRCSEKLTGNGAIAILYPSLSSRPAIAQRDRWAAFQERLSYFFTPDTLQLLATRCGYGDFMSFVTARDALCEGNAGMRRWFERGGALMLCRPVARPNPNLLSVIFPVYNERPTVEESLQRVLRKEIPGVEIEIVVVESNSTDGSREIVERYRDHPRVHIVYEEKPQGKGHAVRAGLQHAKGDVILFQDADLEYDVADYDMLVAPLFELRRNFVLGSRHDARGQAWKIRHFAKQPGLTSIVNFAHLAMLWMFNTLYAQTLKDPFTMYKVFRRDCLFGLSFECNRFDFDYEINIKLLRKGYRPVEIPVNYVSRPFSEGKKVSFFGDPPTWVRAMLKMRRAPLYER